MILANVSNSGFHSITFCLRNLLQIVGFPTLLQDISAFSCDVEIGLSKRCFAVSKNPGFTTSHDLFVFGKYPNIEPKSVSFVPPLPQ